jgi:hypothetical protein
MLVILIFFSVRLPSTSPSDAVGKKRGGAPTSEGARGVIIHMSKRYRMQPKDIASLIPNPRMELGRFGGMDRDLRNFGVLAG